MKTISKTTFCKVWPLLLVLLLLLLMLVKLKNLANKKQKLSNLMQKQTELNQNRFAHAQTNRLTNQLKSIISE